MPDSYFPHLVFSTKDDDLNRDSILVKECSYQDINTTITLGELIAYIKYNYPEINFGEISIISPTQILVPFKNDTELRLSINQKFKQSQYKFQLNVLRYCSDKLYVQTKSQLNKILVKNLILLVESQFDISTPKSFRTKLSTQVKLYQIDQFLDAISYQHMIDDQLNGKQDRNRLHKYLLEQLRSSDNPVNSLLLSSYLFHNSELVSKEEIVDRIFCDELTESDIEYLDVFGSIYPLMMKKYTKKAILMQSLDVLIFKLAFHLFITNDRDSQLLDNLFLTSGKLAEVSSVDIKVKANIYNNVASQLAKSFNSSLIRYYHQLSFQIWIDIITWRIDHESDVVLSSIYNYIDANYDVLDSHKEVLRPYLASTVRGVNVSYTIRYLSFSIAYLLGFDIKFDNELEQELVRRFHFTYSKILKFQPIEDIIYQLKMKINEIREIIECLNPKHEFLNDTIFLIQSQGLPYVESILLIINSGPNFSKVEDIINSVSEKLKEEVAFVYNFINPIIEGYYLMYLVTNLEKLSKAKAFFVLNHIDNEQLDQGIITPKDLLSNLIRGYYGEYTLSRLEISYLKNSGILVDEFSNEIKNQVELIEEFSLYIRKQGAIQQPQLQGEISGDGEEITPEFEVSISI